MKSYVTSVFILLSALVCRATDIIKNDDFNYDVTIEAEHKIRLIDKNSEALQARLDLIREAKSSIKIEVFYFNPDQSGKIILAALLEKKKQNPGIEIQLHLDSWGSEDFTDSYISLLQRNNIEVRKYNGSRIFGFGPERKNHRKTWLIDGSLALIGGFNVADEHLGFSMTYNMIDRDILIKGPVLKYMLEAYTKLWNQSASFVASSKPDPDLKIQPWFSDQKSVMPEWVSVPKIRFLTNIRREGEPEAWLKNQLDLILSSAKKQIVIEAKYFMPSVSTLWILNERLSAKIALDILTNREASEHPIDELMVFFGRFLLSYLKLNGAMIHYLSDTSLGTAQGLNSESQKARWGTHAKTIVVDDRVIIGSYNMDFLSGYLNIEQFVVIDSEDLAQKTLHSIRAREL